LKKLKFIVEGFGVDPNSKEAVTVVVSSFTGSLDNWDADHTDEIFKLDSIDALTAYVRVSFFLMRTWRARIYILRLN